jgi:hypothetical protein
LRSPTMDQPSYLSGNRKLAQTAMNSTHLYWRNAALAFAAILFSGLAQPREQALWTPLPLALACTLSHPFPSGKETVSAFQISVKTRSWTLLCFSVLSFAPRLRPDSALDSPSSLSRDRATPRNGRELPKQVSCQNTFLCCNEVFVCNQALCSKGTK